MKLKNTTTAVETNNVTEGNTFGIKSSPKTFAILSSGLYSNKIEAVVRELSCNAYDSHIERNCIIDQGKATKYTAPRDKNIRIQFPTAFDPFFSVRDFGIGLTPDDVENIYTVYFESTKQDSNDYVGALGLGSKSPFSYAQSFNVIATKNGHRVIYTMFINGQGIPQPAKLDEGPVESFFDTDEDIPEEEFYDGVEVKVPAEPSDSHSFTYAAEQVYRFFEVCPELINYDRSEIAYYKNNNKISQFIDTVYVGHAWNHNAQQYAVQGNVSYPIVLSHEDFRRAITEINEINEDDLLEEKSKYTSEEIDELYKFYKTVFRNFTFYVEFKIGDLDVAASREELSYDASTILAIIDKLKLIYDNIDLEFEKHMEQFSTKWEKAREIWHIDGRYDLSVLHDLFKRSESHLRYLKLENLPMLQIRDSYSSKTVEYTPEYTTFEVPKDASFNIRVCGRHSFKRFQKIEYHETNPLRLYGIADSNRLQVLKDNVIFVVNDTKRGASTIAKAYFKENTSASTVILFEPEILGKDVDEINNFVDQIELKLDNPGIEVKYISEIRKNNPELIARKPSNRNNIGYYSLSENQRVYHINNSIDSLPKEDTVVYIPFKNQKPADTGLDLESTSKQLVKNFTIDGVIDALNLLLDVKRLDPNGNIPTVIGLNQKMLRQVNDHDNWVSINEYVEDEYSKMFGDKAACELLEKSIATKIEKKRHLRSVHWPFGNDTTKKLKESVAKHPELDDIKEFCGMYLDGAPELTEKETLYKRFNKVVCADKKSSIDRIYPMLRYLDSEYSWSSAASNKKIKRVTEYLIQCKKGESK